MFSLLLKLFFHAQNKEHTKSIQYKLTNIIGRIRLIMSYSLSELSFVNVFNLFIKNSEVALIFFKISIISNFILNYTSDFKPFWNMQIYKNFLAMFVVVKKLNRGNLI